MKEKIDKLLHAQLTEKQKMYLAVLGVMLLQIILMILNVERIGGSAGSDWFNFGNWLFHNKYSGLTFGMLGLLLVAFLFAYQRLLPGYIILEVITFVLGFANQIVYSKRNRYISFKDFGQVNEVKGLELDLVSWISGTVVVLFILGIVLGVVTAIVDRKWKMMQEKKMNIVPRFVGTVVFLTGFFVIVQLSARKDYFNLFHGLVDSRNMGGIVYLMESSVSIKDETVTDEVVDELYGQFMEEELPLHKDSDKRPNVIAIMSESFWDMKYMDGIINLSEDPLKEYRKLADSCVSGEIGVNVYGGGTVTTEREFLTGISELYMNSLGDVYKALYTKKQESIVSYFSKLGYTTMAMHPYKAEYWSRDIGYAGMGFDHFYDITEFDNRETYRGFISDLALSKEIIEKVAKENENGKRAFCFAVSVQNHGVILEGIQAGDDDTYREDIQVEYPRGEVSDALKKSTVEYVNGIASSVSALKELIDYYEKSDEETIIVFFGDHAPDIALDTCRMYGMTSIEHTYRTPYLIWSNFELEDKDYGVSSASYLSALMIDYVGLPLTNQVAMNLYMQRRYPVHTYFEIQAMDGTDIKAIINSGKAPEVLNDYMEATKEEQKVNVVNKWKMQNGSMKTKMW